MLDFVSSTPCKQSNDEDVYFCNHLIRTGLFAGMRNGIAFLPQQSTFLNSLVKSFNSDLFGQQKEWITEPGPVFSSVILTDDFGTPLVPLSDHL